MLHRQWRPLTDFNVKWPLLSQSGPTHQPFFKGRLNKSLSYLNLVSMLSRRTGQATGFHLCWWSSSENAQPRLYFIQVLPSNGLCRLKRVLSDACTPCRDASKTQGCTLGDVNEQAGALLPICSMEWHFTHLHATVVCSLQYLCSKQLSIHLLSVTCLHPSESLAPGKQICEPLLDCALLFCIAGGGWGGPVCPCWHLCQVQIKLSTLPGFFSSDLERALRLVAKHLQLCSFNLVDNFILTWCCHTWVSKMNLSVTGCVHYYLSRTCKW